MDKPIAMSAKEYLMRTQSIRTNIPLKVIETVIDNQFEEANKALRDNNTIELSGFGKFIFNYKKAVKRYDHSFLDQVKYLKELENKDITENYRERLLFRLKMIETFQNNVKPKIDEFLTNTADSGGIQEQTISPSKAEGNDNSSIRGEEADL